MQRNHARETTLEKQYRKVTIAGQPFALLPRDVTRALRGLDPEPIASHFVVIGSRRFPPKQVISAVTGLDRADFTTHQARRTLMRLGFLVGRRESLRRSKVRVIVKGHAHVAPDDTQRLAEQLGPLVGQWVAIKDGDVLHASKSPHALVRWLGRHGQKADSVFRVPEDQLAATGLAPL